MNPITREESLLDGQDLEPITRKEQFIKRIYDKTQEIPEPITREEWFLKKAGEGTSPVTIEQLNATENGTYSEQGKAYSPVIVEVPEPTLITKSITANGTYTASADNADGYSQVTVAVEGFKKKSIANTPTDIASFNDGTANPMPSLEISIEPQQDLHGYGYPWPAGGGVNKLPASVYSTTQDGITYTATADGKIKISGTATINNTILVNLSDEVTVQSGQYLHMRNDAIGTNVTFCINFKSGNRRTPGFTSVNRIFDISASAGEVINQIGIIYIAGEIIDITFQPSIESNSTDTAYSPYENICPISGWDKAQITVTDDLTTPTETHTLSIPFHDNSDNPITVYGGRLNVTSGELTATHANIASYNGEAINEPWISSMDVYSAGTTPTTGAQVVYPLATPQTYQLTPAQVTTLLGQNNIFADCGQILQGEYFVTL